MNDARAKVDRAQRLVAEGKPQQALADLRRALSLSPGNAELNNAMALVLFATGQNDQGLYFARRALDILPNDAAMQTNMGMYLLAQGKPEEALPHFFRAVQLDPNFAEAHLGLSHTHRARHHTTAAAEELEKSLALRPDDAATALLYTGMLIDLGRVAEAVTFARNRLAQHPDPGMANLLAHALNYHAGATPNEVRTAHEDFGRLKEQSAATPAHPNSPDPDRPLRIGIISSELRWHSVAFFLRPLLEHLDRSAFKAICYSTGIEDDMTDRLRPLAAEWRPVSKLDDTALASRIRADAIDILIETTGLTGGERLGVMALKPAPIQVTYLGYPNTTGLRAIDYRIADSRTDPPGAESLCIETLARLDPTFICYGPVPETPDVPLTSALRSQCSDPAPTTFASFSAPAKINDPLIALWSRVLTATPGSRLILKALAYRDPGLRAAMTARFANAGIDPSRIEIRGTADRIAEHLRTYEQVDIALDTFPYNGTTTTCEALWMGVPAVTLAGTMHAGRVGLSLLQAVGLPDLITTTEDEFIATAVKLAADHPRRAELRQSLRGKMAASSLCDGPAYARRFEALLRTMWREWCAQTQAKSPQSRGER